MYTNSIKAWLFSYLPVLPEVLHWVMYRCMLRCLWFWNLIWEASLIGSHEVFTLLCFIVFFWMMWSSVYINNDNGSLWCCLSFGSFMSFLNTFLTIMTGWARVSRFNGPIRCSRFPRTRRAEWTSWREGQWSGHQSTVIFIYLYI